LESTLPTLNPKPSVVIISLSLFNEGIIKNPAAEQSFEDGINYMVDFVKVSPLGRLCFSSFPRSDFLIYSPPETQCPTDSWWIVSKQQI